MIDALERSEDDYNTLLKNMKAHIAEKFSTSVTAKEYIKMFNELISQRLHQYFIIN